MSVKNILKESFPELYMKVSEIRSRRFQNKVVYLCRAGDFKSAIELIYSYNYKQKINWSNPKTFNEKIQCLKLGEYFNNPLVTKCVDKVEAKKYVAEKGLDCRCAELYQVCSNVGEIDWDALPNKFVIKCNHGSSYNLICKDKTSFDIEQAKQQLKQWMDEDYYTLYAEPQYMFIEKKILVEEYLGDNLKTCKIYCFHGVPKIIHISFDGEESNQYYDMDFKHLEISIPNARIDGELKKPEKWDTLISVATNLSQDFPLVRVDLYDDGKEIYFSELTFIPTGGYMEFDPPETNELWGSWLNI